MKSLKGIVSKVLRISEKRIDDSTSPAKVKTWDSLRGLLLITELENNYKIKFTIKEILSIKNVGDIKKILKKHNAAMED